MQETRYEDGTVERELIVGKDTDDLTIQLKQKYNKKINDPKVIEIRQKKIMNNIIHYPHPVLREKCTKVIDVSTIKNFAKEMLKSMKEAKGIGLAAPQVGVPINLFVCNITGKDEDDCIFVNPEISDLRGQQKEIEGCLSFPGVQVECTRAKTCWIKAEDENGMPINRELSGLLARVVQHECEHLNKILLIDRMNLTDKVINKKALDRLKLIKKEEEKEIKKQIKELEKKKKNDKK